ncbi:hypothetical protein [Streptomyces sp. NEAU-H3]|uniref:hypothetical protein n=1 Tax=Streptomyces sp. NEAU-H3 TaxID=2720636 RepID=UPI001438EA87|nr:hypothetical protein [Streptomyces sp. NEAU-H3]NJA57648.1 hypothetical protein [Streptomyces sp. NEAU-H3]
MMRRKRRNVVERCFHRFHRFHRSHRFHRFHRLKQWRSIATRYDETAESCQAAVPLASLQVWA